MHEIDIFSIWIPNLLMDLNTHLDLLSSPKVACQNTLSNWSYLEGSFNVVSNFNEQLENFTKCMACVDARVEDLGFEDSNPRMGMYTWWLALELSCHVLVQNTTQLGFVNPKEDKNAIVESLCDTSLVHLHEDLPMLMIIC